MPSSEQTAAPTKKFRLGRLHNLGLLLKAGAQTPKAMATGTINCVAAGLGGFLGPALVGYQAARTHSFRSGFAVLVVALVIAGVLPLTVRVRSHVVAPSAGE